MRRKLSLYEQAVIEEKRRKILALKADYNPNKKFTEILKALLPAIEWKPKQARYINAKQLITWYKGGYKSGKTFTGVSVDIGLAYVNRPYPGILVHQTNDGLKLTIIPLIEEICQKNGIEFEVQTMNTKYKVTFKFGLNKRDWGTLYLASGDVPKSLKGPKLAFGHIDEPFIMKKEICQVIQSRLAEQGAKLRRLQYTGTPEPEHMAWGWDLCDAPDCDNDKLFMITMSTLEVKEHLAEGYVEGLMKEMTPGEVETFIKGNYRNLSQGKVYAFENDKNEYDKLRDEPKRNINVDTMREYVLGWDFNVNQMSCVLIELCWKYKTQLEEFRILGRSNTQELATLVINRLKTSGYIRKDGWTKFGRSIIITGDSAGESHSTKSKQTDYEIIINEFDDADIKIQVYVPTSNPSVRDRVNYINRQFANETFFIEKNCILSIRDRELVSWKMGADGFHIDKSKAELTHLSDAADYAVWNTQAMTSGDDEDEGSIFVELRGR